MNNEKLSFLQLAILAVTMVNRPATASELWQFVVDNKLHYKLKTFDDKVQQFSGKTPEDSFKSQFVKDKNNFQAIENTKPKQYILKNQQTPLIDKTNNNQSNTANAIGQKQNNKKLNFHERDLHPVLCYFLKTNDYFQAYSKTIFHEESQKGTKGEDKWLYPDMVAVNFEYANYQKNNVLNFIKKFDILPIKIFSFEIKKELGHTGISYLP